MKKIKPKYPQEYVYGHTFYGSHSNTDRTGSGKKSTYVCTTPNCNYTSRVPRWQSFSKMQYTTSINCPYHNTELKNIGDVVRLPKAGSSKRKILLKKILK
jgi:hypothetical protein